jgi:glycosyltransferase involved in cell wall biosynthesis
MNNCKTNDIELSIIVPCLNEAENVTDILEKLEDLICQNNLKAEVTLIDDLSDDDTFQIATSYIEKHGETLNLNVIQRYQPRRGYGAVVRYGLAHARGKYAIFVSADGVDPIDLIPKFVGMMRSGTDMVQCSRYLEEGDDDTIPFKYKFYQFIYRFLVRLLLGENIRDSTYAFKMFDRVEMLALGLHQNRFSISPEITFKTLLMDGKVEYVAAGQGTRAKGNSKFYFNKEGFGYGYVLLRAWLHRIGLVLWF